MKHIDRNSSETVRRESREAHEAVRHEHPKRAHEKHELNHQALEDRVHEKDTAHSDALDNASSIEEVRRPHYDKSPAERRVGPVTRKQLDHEFQRTMTSIQSEMSPAERTFSKFIHRRAVERSSEFLSATIARPNALLAGSIGAFILMLAIYLFAKSVGYPLSGFEPIAAFIVGWIIGLFYDYLRIMVTGKR